MTTETGSPAGPSQPGRDYALILADAQRGRRSLSAKVAGVLVCVVACFWVTDLLDGERLGDGIPAIGIEGWLLAFGGTLLFTATGAAARTFRQTLERQQAR